MRKQWIGALLCFGFLSVAFAQGPLKNTPRISCCNETHATPSNGTYHPLPEPSEKRSLYNPKDPYENYNRHAYKMNKKLDEVIFRPVASLYKNATPAPLRKGVNNFFSNLNQVPTFINDVLQLNLPRAGKDFLRFTVNTTVGIGGLIDVASCMGLEKNPQDFGLTLARWGYQCSNYLVLPILGPSTVRDAINWPIYYQMTVYPYIPDETLRYSLLTLDFIDTRTQFLDLDPVIEQSFDPYVFERDAYLQRRNYLIRKNLGFSDKEATPTPNSSQHNENEKDEKKDTSTKPKDTSKTTKNSPLKPVKFQGENDEY